MSKRIIATENRNVAWPGRYNKWIQLRKGVEVSKAHLAKLTDAQIAKYTEVVETVDTRETYTPDECLLIGEVWDRFGLTHTGEDLLAHFRLEFNTHSDASVLCMFRQCARFDNQHPDKFALGDSSELFRDTMQQINPQRYIVN